jgi:hypothetical protein
MLLILQIIIVLIVAGIIFWAIQQFPTIPTPFRAAIIVLLAVILCWILLSMVGLAPGIGK